MKLDDLATASVSEVAALPVRDHARLANELADRLADHKKAAAVLDAALNQAYGGQNSTGTSHCEVDGFDVKATVPKLVSWDSDILENMATDPSVAEYVDCKLSVSESRYKAMPERIRKVVAGARTVKAGKTKFEFLSKEG